MEAKFGIIVLFFCEGCQLEQKFIIIAHEIWAESHYIFKFTSNQQYGC